MLAINPKIKQKAEDIRKKIFGSEVRESLASGIEAISEDVEATIGRQGYVEEQFQDVLDETTGKDVISAPELIAARNGKSNLKTRLDEEHAEVTAQLQQTTKQTADKTFYNNLSVHKKPRPLITILDDDTRNELYSVIFPVIKELNVPISSAAITGRIGNNVATISMSEYKEMRDSGLVEFISHTVNHDKLTNLTLEQAEKELADSKKWLIENGGNPDFFVPPFGGDNADIKALIRKYYKASFKTFSTGYTLSPPMNTYSIRRSDFDTSVVSISEQKTRLDQTLATNGWIIINTHSAYPSFNATDFRELINYAKTIGLEFTTIGEGMQHFGNLLELESSPSDEDYAVIDVNGKRHGSLDNPFYVTDSAQITFNTPSTNFRVGVSETYFKAALASANGWGTSGTLVTTRMLNPDFSFQYYYVYGSNQIRYRYAVGESWSEFVRVDGVLGTNKLLNIGDVPPNSTKDISLTSSVFKIGDNLIANPLSVLPSGIVFNTHITSDGNGLLRVGNITSASISVGSLNWVFKPLHARN